MDSQEKVAVFEELNLHRVVEVTRRLAIDGDDVLVPEIGTSGDGLCRYLGRDAFGFLEHVVRKGSGRPYLAMITWTSRRAHPAFLAPRLPFREGHERARVTHDLDDDHLTQTSSRLFSLCHEYFVEKVRVEGNDACPFVAFSKRPTTRVEARSSTSTMRPSGFPKRPFRSI